MSKAYFAALKRVRAWINALPARIWPLKWRPLLDAWIDIGLLQVQTGIWREQWHMDATDYLIVEVRLLRKWGFRFRLYDTAIRRTDR